MPSHSEYIKHLQEMATRYEEEALYFIERAEADPEFAEASIKEAAKLQDAAANLRKQIASAP